MGVLGEQRIVGPLDQIDAARDRAVALRQLQPQAERLAARRRGDGQHVRPLHWPAVTYARHREDEAGEAAGLVVGTDQDPAGLDRHHEHRTGHDVVVVGAPYLALQPDDGVEVVECLEVAQPHLVPSLP